MTHMLLQINGMQLLHICANSNGILSYVANDIVIFKTFGKVNQHAEKFLFFFFDKIEFYYYDAAIIWCILQLFETIFVVRLCFKISCRLGDWRTRLHCGKMCS